MSAYTQYYTSSDVNLLLEVPSSPNPILLDKLRTIAFNESLSVAPIYGVNKNRFGMLSSGNLLVNGYFELNFIHPLYLKTALTELARGANPLASRPPREIIFNDDVSTVSKNVADKKLADIAELQANATGIDTFPEGFNLRIVFNNGNMIYQDASKSILIEYVKITGSQMTSSVSMDGNVSIAYQFLARQIV